MGWYAHLIVCRTGLPYWQFKKRTASATGIGKPTDSFSYNVFQASFWRRFWLLTRPFWSRPLRGKNGSFADGSGAAWGLLMLLIALIFGTTGQS